jgi:hypothetical protein
VGKWQLPENKLCQFLDFTNWVPKYFHYRLFSWKHYILESSHSLN